MRLRVAVSTVTDFAKCRFCRACRPFFASMMELKTGTQNLNWLMNLRLCLGNSHFSLHSGLCKNSPIEWWQVDFRRPMIPPLSGDQWSLKSTRIEAGTV